MASLAPAIGDCLEQILASGSKMACVVCERAVCLPNIRRAPRVRRDRISSMKLIFAVVQNRDADALFRRLNQAGIGATRIGSSGGYLRHANATVFIGVEEQRLTECIALVRETCGRRIHRAPAWAAEIGDIDLASVSPTEEGGGIYMILPVDRFIRIERALVAEAAR